MNRVEIIKGSKAGGECLKISDLIGEATEYDKKETLEERKPKSWLKSVSAFANGVGGVLVFGVNDDEEPVGLEDAKNISEKISEIIKTKMDPIPQVIMEFHKEQGKEFIILISIPRAFRHGTNSNERFSKPSLHEIIASRSYTTKHGRRSCKFFLVLDSILISVSPAFSSTNKWYYESVH